MISQLLIGKEVEQFFIGEHSSSLLLAGGYKIVIESLCRFIGLDGTFVSNEDHNQVFGLPAPFNASREIQKQIKEQKITKVSVRDDTGDLTLYFDVGRLEIICNSSGYECYQIHGPNSLIIIGRGGK